MPAAAFPEIILDRMFVVVAMVSDKFDQITFIKLEDFRLLNMFLHFLFPDTMMFSEFDQMTFAFQQDFGLYILLGAIVFGFVLSFAVSTISEKKLSLSHNCLI